jgi:hypothetical protein
MKNLITKIISSFLLVSILVVFFGVTPNIPRAEAVVPVTDVGNTGINVSKLLKAVWTGTLDSKSFWKDFVLDQVAFTIAQKMSERMVKGTINWANSGFKKDKNPLYVGDLGAVVRSLSENEALLFLQDDVLKGSAPFAKDVAKILISEYTTTYKELTKFTLEEIAGEDFDKYQAGDFAAGGWAAWSANNLPQNNTLAYYERSKSELARRIAEKRELELEKLKQNSGFNDVSECPEAMRAYITPNVGGGVVDQPTDAEVNKYADDAGISYQQALTELTNAAENASVATPAQDRKYICRQTSTTTPGKAVEALLTQAITKPGTSIDNINKWGQLLISSLTKLSDGLTKVGVSKIYGEVNSQLSTFYADAIELIDGEDYEEQQSDNSIAFDITKNQEIINFTRTLDGYHPENEGEIGDNGEIVQGAVGVIEDLESEIDIYKQTIELLITFPGKILPLDRCLPGPDTGWEERLQDKFDKAARKLQRKAGKSDKDRWSNRLSSRENAFDVFKQRVELFSLIAKPSNPGDPESGDTIESAALVSNMVAQATNYSSERETLIDRAVEKATLLTSLRLLRSKWDTANKLERQSILRSYKTLSSQLNLISGSAEAKVQLAQFQEISSEMLRLIVICNAEKAVKFGSSSVLLNKLGGILGLSDEDKEQYLSTLSQKERARFEELLGDGGSSDRAIEIDEVLVTSDTSVSIRGTIIAQEIEEATITAEYGTYSDVLSGNGTKITLSATHNSNEEFEISLDDLTNKKEYRYRVCSDITSADLNQCSTIDIFKVSQLNSDIEDSGPEYDSIEDFNTKYFTDTEKSNAEIYEFCYRFFSGNSVLLRNQYKYKGISCSSFYQSDISDYTGR